LKSLEGPLLRKRDSSRIENSGSNRASTGGKRQRSEGVIKRCQGLGTKKMRLTNQQKVQSRIKNGKAIMACAEWCEQKR